MELIFNGLTLSLILLSITFGCKNNKFSPKICVVFLLLYIFLITTIYYLKNRRLENYQTNSNIFSYKNITSGEKYFEEIYKDRDYVGNVLNFEVSMDNDPLETIIYFMTDKSNKKLSISISNYEKKLPLNSKTNPEIYIDGNCKYKLEEKKLICNYRLPINDNTNSVQIYISNDSTKEIGSLSLKVDYSYDRSKGKSSNDESSNDESSNDESSNDESSNDESYNDESYNDESSNNEIDNENTEESNTVQNEDNNSENDFTKSEVNINSESNNFEFDESLDSDQTSESILNSEGIPNSESELQLSEKSMDNIQNTINSNNITNSNITKSNINNSNNISNISNSINSNQKNINNVKPNSNKNNNKKLPDMVDSLTSMTVNELKKYQDMILSIDLNNDNKSDIKQILDFIVNLINLKQNNNKEKTRHKNNSLFKKPHIPAISQHHMKGVSNIFSPKIVISNDDDENDSMSSGNRYSTGFNDTNDARFIDSNQVHNKLYSGKKFDKLNLRDRNLLKKHITEYDRTDIKTCTNKINCQDPKLNKKIADNLMEKPYNPGFSFAPPETWKFDEKAPPKCIPQDKCYNQPVPMYDSGAPANPLEYTGVGTILPKFSYVETHDPKFYKNKKHNVSYNNNSNLNTNIDSYQVDIQNNDKLKQYEVEVNNNMADFNLFAKKRK